LRCVVIAVTVALSSGRFAGDPQENRIVDARSDVVIFTTWLQS
jgi:hypothetical protein